MNPIKSGFIVRNFVNGIILALLGSGLVVVYNMVNFTMEIRGYGIPEWSVYMLSFLFFIAGVILVAGSGRGDRCAACGVVLMLEEVAFSLRDGDKIVHAVRELDAELIKDLRKLKEGEPMIILIMNYCHACRRVAKIAVMKEDKNRSLELVPEQIVTGPPVWKLLDVIDKLRGMQQE